MTLSTRQLETRQESAMTEFTVVDISWSDRIKIHYDPNEQVHGLPEADGFSAPVFTASTGVIRSMDRMCFCILARRKCPPLAGLFGRGWGSI